MKTLLSLIRLGTVALLVFGSVVCTPRVTQPSGNNSSTLAANIGQRTNNANPSASFKPGVNRVTFQSEDENMVGNLYLPAAYKPGDKLPAVVVTASWTSVKEQMAGLYAKKLAEQGFATLAFDFRNWGESSGQPRSYESPSEKIQDIHNAVTYLQSLWAIDANRVGGLAVCASAGYMAHAIAQGAGVKSFATVAAWLHDPQTVGQIYSGDRSVQRFIAAGEVARREFEQTGKVEYVAAHSSTDRNAAMLGADYYSKPDRGAITQWKNQFAVMSWSEWLRFDALAPAPKIAIPTLLVHSDNSALPDNVRRFYNNLSGPKDLFWTQGQHSDFYDKEPYVTKAVQAAAAHFNATLSNAKLSQR